MNKANLRATYKEKRKALNAKEKMKLDDLLLLQFQQIDFSGVNCILTYWPMEHQVEPNTHLFSGYLRHMIPGLAVAYPKINRQDKMDAILINEETVYTNNHWNLTEPIDGLIIAPSTINLVLVPLLVFDLDGYRVGYGKGYYDRFLAQCNQDTILVGLSYFDPITSISDTNEFDIPLNLGITPQLIYEF